MDRDEQRNAIDEIFIEALELVGAARRGYLEKACAGDEDLRREVDDLLAIADRSPDLMEPPDIGLIPATLGRYEILSERGRGGMGIVFAARDTSLLRTVALKVLPRYLSQSDRGRERFTREARILARLRHPNIAILYSLEECDGIHFLTMEYIEGTTLAEIRGRRRLRMEEIVGMAVQVSRALETAHAEGICHCDLKPANIMIAPTGHVSLLDFGIARAFRQIQPADPTARALHGAQPTVAAGTPGYMAPEQADGRAVDQRSDLWSLGVIMLECLTDRALTTDVLRAERDWTRLLPRTTPTELADVLRGCLEPDPDRRQTSAADVRARLESIAMSVRPPGRRRLAAWAVLAGLILIATVAADHLSTGAGPVAELRTRSQHRLDALDAAGNVVWSRRFTTTLRGGATVLWDRPAVAGDESPASAAVCIASVREGDAGGKLVALDPRNGRERWWQSPRWTPPVNAAGPFQYRWLSACDWPRRAEPVLLAAVRDGIWYAMGVEAIAADGELLGVYHHPGPLVCVPAEIDRDAVGGDIVMHGTNSSARFVRRLVPFTTEHHPGCVVRLTPGAIDGQAFPYSQDLPEVRDWPSLPAARERAYLLIPMVNPHHGARVKNFQWHEPGSVQGACHVAIEDGRVVLLDRDFRPVRAVITLYSFADSVYQAGAAANPPYLYIHDGVEEWLDVPLEY